MCKNENCECGTKTSITAFQIGADPEKDVVHVEDLLMKLALVEVVVKNMTQYIDAVEGNDGVKPDDIEEPERWAVTGMFQNLMEVNRTLKCGCWGHEVAHLH